MAEQTSVSDIYRRALEIRKSNPNAAYKDVKAQIVSEFSGRPFPPTYNLTIPELDNIAPEEDWSSGLSLVLRGIQTEDWKDIADGIVLSLEQVETYVIQSGREDDPAKEWRNRSKGIARQTEQNLSKWMPEDLMNLAQRSGSKK